MMFAVAAAAGRQISAGVHNQDRANHREAEDGYQQNCRESPHRFMLLRFRGILQALVGADLGFAPARNQSSARFQLALRLEKGN
jgi:hypothetical protein